VVSRLPDTRPHAARSEGELEPAAGGSGINPEQAFNGPCK